MRTFLAGVVRRNHQHPATTPVLLVFNLAAPFAPSLIQDDAIQAGFLFTLRPGFSLVPAADFDMFRP